MRAKLGLAEAQVSVRLNESLSPMLCEVISDKDFSIAVDDAEFYGEDLSAADAMLRKQLFFLLAKSILGQQRAVGAGRVEWDPAFLTFCSRIKASSNGAYAALASVTPLPSIKTLQRAASAMTDVAGVSRRKLMAAHIAAKHAGHKGEVPVAITADVVYLIGELYYNASAQRIEGYSFSTETTLEHKAPKKKSAAAAASAAAEGGGASSARAHHPPPSFGTPNGLGLSFPLAPGEKEWGWG